ncbi:MAG: SIMPL domain-containing protein, partial [Acidobacteriia bacterium]|nr:SIMPL domain-containing protein [Terriglobia bacterium]
MPRAAGLGLVFLALPAIVLAQAAGTIQAQGSATVFANPDQAQFNVAVVTDGSTAQAAAQANAASTSAVLGALKQALGTSGNIQTIG